MKKIIVMITGLGGGGHGAQILKAINLASTPYKIVGGDMSPMSKGLFEVDYPYVLPPANNPRYIDTLLAVCRKHNVQVLFHGSEPELKIMSKRRKSLEKIGVFLPINPQHVLDICMDKSRAIDWLKQNKFDCPATITISSVNDLRKVDFLPAVLKPSIGGGGSINIFLAQTKNDLITFGKYLLSLYSEFIVQEYVGTPDSEYTVGVLIDMDGKLLNSIAVKRMMLSGLSNKIKTPNITGNDKLGPILAISSGISQGEIGYFPEVTKPCEKIALALGCRGAVNIQCRYVDGKVYIFEINPRFSGTTSLRAMVGYNEPDILIRKHVLGKKITPRFSYKQGFILRGLNETFVEQTNIPKAIDLLRSK